ncbi:MAG: hypothetical protein RSH78_05930, partial [Bacilli bacterium]
MIIGKIISISDIRVNVFRLDNTEIKIGDILETKYNNKSYSFEVAEMNGNEIICISLDLVIGLSKGLDVYKKSAGLEVEYSDKVLGRVFNSYGEPIDGLKLESTYKKNIDSKNLKLSDIL